tara:strand:+ start:302 stop:616 length:315 start_codon:yes stop_codon:yes gene_type:complete
MKNGYKPFKMKATQAGFKNPMQSNFGVGVDKPTMAQDPSGAKFLGAALGVASKVIGGIKKVKGVVDKVKGGINKAKEIGGKVKQFFNKDKEEGTGISDSSIKTE